MVTHLFLTATCMDENAFVTTFGVIWRRVSVLNIYLTSTSFRYHIQIRIRLRKPTCDISKALLLQRCVESFLGFYPSLHLQNDPIFFSLPIPFSTTAVTECVSSHPSNSNVIRSLLDTTNHRILLHECGSVLNEEVEPSLMKSISFLE